MTKFDLFFEAKNGDAKKVSFLRLTIELLDGDTPKATPRHRELMFECLRYRVHEYEAEELVEVLHDMGYVNPDEIFEHSLDGGVLRVGLKEEILDSTDWWDISYLGFDVCPDESENIDDWYGHWSIHTHRVMSWDITLIF